MSANERVRSQNLNVRAHCVFAFISKSLWLRSRSNVNTSKYGHSVQNWFAAVCFDVFKVNGTLNSKRITTSLLIKSTTT